MTEFRGLSAMAEDSGSPFQSGDENVYVPQPISNMQETLGINMSIVIEGLYPSRDGSGGHISIGYMEQFAFNFAERGSAFANGQLLPISSYTALFSILGTTYGGDGRTTFSLPNQQGRLSVGSGSSFENGFFPLGARYGSELTYLSEGNLPIDFGGFGIPAPNAQPSLNLNWVIHTDPSASGANVAGSVHLFAGNFQPNGALFCDGRTLQIADYPDLFARIGTTYGGDGITTFQIPDLRGRTVSGADSENPIGSVIGDPNFAVTGDTLPANVGGNGALVDNQQPGVAMQVLIAVQGYFPSRSQEDPQGTDVSAFDDEPTLGQIIYYAGTDLPPGFVPANGALLPIASNTALFSLLGTIYGGDGRTTFALPDFDGRVAAGFGTGPGLTPLQIGQVTGSDDIAIPYESIPGRSQDGDAFDNTIRGSEGDDIFTGGDGADMLIGNGGTDSLDGGSGDDYLNGGDGIDTLIGGEGDDVLYSGRGEDIMRGGYGNDFYDVVYLNDTIIENVGEGIDTIRTGVVSYTLGDNVENLIMYQDRAITGIGNDLDNRIEGSNSGNVLNGLGGADVIYGFNGDDTISGGLGDDFLSGRKDNDVVMGDAGNDRIYGGTGDDVLWGGADQDYLTGNDGADIFAFANGDFAGLRGETADRISDFDGSEGDRIDLSAVDAIAGTVEDDAFTFIGSAEFSGTAGELRFTVWNGHTNIYGDVDGDGVADFAIRVDGEAPLIGADFIL